MTVDKTVNLTTEISKFRVKNFFEIMMTNCNICNRKFQNSELLQSNQDEYFCKECFKLEYCTVTNKKRPSLLNRCEGDSPPKSKKMFPPAELASIQRERELLKVNSIFTSKRPLQCPHVDCNRYVSIFDLTIHFQHEHMEIPIIQACLEVRNPLNFFPRDIRYGVKQCLILLNVASPSEDNTEENINSQPEKPKTPVTIAVLASRIAPVQLAEEYNECIDEEDQGASTHGVNDKIIIWAASNVLCDYNYTIAASTICEDIRVKYYGPVLQLGNTSTKLCKEGHGLILSHFHFLGMSENGTKPMKLDIIIHNQD